MSNDDKETIKFHLQRLYGIALMNSKKENEQEAATLAHSQILKIIGWNGRDFKGDKP